MAELVEQAVNQSVQTADINKAEAFGITSVNDWFYGVIGHREIVPSWGIRQRDWELRQISYAVHNTLFQGAVAGFIKRVQSVPWKIHGGKILSNYYQDVLQNPDFGDGWDTFVSKLLWDYLTQDFGAVFEVIGRGNPQREIKGRALGIAHMDSLSCVATKNRDYPLIYFNEEDGRMHRIHRTRAVRLVDSPSPKRTAYGLGICALSRYISEANVDIALGKHDNEQLSDLPPVGIVRVRGMTNTQWNQALRTYELNRQADGQNVFRNSIVLHAGDTAEPLEIEMIPFSALPEGFDPRGFIESHVNKLALALGVDPQDIWPLTGAPLGTGTQSIILDAKARGKLFGSVLQMLTRVMNRYVLPPELEFKFQFKDTEEDETTAKIAKYWIDITNSAGFLTDIEKRQLLANNVEAFKDILLDPSGQLIELPDDDPKPNEQDTSVDDAAPNAPTDTDDQQPAIADSDSPNDPAGERGLFLRRRGLDVYRGKAYAETVSEFSEYLSYLFGQHQEGYLTLPQLRVRMRAELKDSGMAAFLDGFAAGGVEIERGELSSEDNAVFLSWLAEQSGYVDTMTVGESSNPDSKAQLWVNKSLNSVYELGRAQADANGMYEFDGDDGAESCADCQRLKGQRHRLKDWNKRQWNPNQSGFKAECGGWRCQHLLRKVRGRERGNY